MIEDNDITLKLHNLPELNEKEYAQLKYDEALKKMLEDPTDENIAAFGDANRYFWQVQDAYRIGLRLKKEYKESHPISFPPMKRVFHRFPDQFA